MYIAVQTLTNQQTCTNPAVASDIRSQTSGSSVDSTLRIPVLPAIGAIIVLLNSRLGHVPNPRNEIRPFLSVFILLEWSSTMLVLPARPARPSSSNGSGAAFLRWRFAALCCAACFTCAENTRKSVRAQRLLGWHRAPSEGPAAHHAPITTHQGQTFSDYATFCI